MACKTEGQMDRRKLQYQKILTLDAIANTISTQFNISIDKEPVPVGKFEDVIDLEHAHMCLESHMHTAEYRYAYVVTKALEHTNIEEIAKVLEAAGEKQKIENGSVEEIFNQVQDRVLDGMPCDETINIIKHDHQSISWEIVEDKHIEFWNQVKGNIDNYYQLLTSYISGILIQTDYIFEIIGDQFLTIRPK